MRNLKKFLALVMAVLMVMSVAVMTGVSAADEADHTEAAQHLNSLSIMKGNENGDLMLANGVTRYQAALFFVQAMTGKTDVNVWNAEKKSAIFTDVAEYGTAIDYAYNINIVRGRGNGVYGYNDPITYQDMLVMAVRALGYETEGMSYPYGYILAAQKLELDEDLDELVNFKAELNRGQTAEIIWNMLNTEIAVDFDGEKIYPGEKYYNKYTGTEVEPKNRKTLLEKSGFADGTIVGVITEAVLNKDDGLDEDDDPYVVLDGDLEIKAADLGITEATLKSTYLGLEVKLYVDCAAEDFESKYADDKAEVVFADFYTYKTVENLGDAGNIKYTVSKTDKKTLTLGNDKFDLDDEDIKFSAYIFGDEGWAAIDVATVLDTFKYDTTEKEYVGTHTYGKIQYRTTTDDDGDVNAVIMLCTPYTFGRYFVRSLKDATTAQKADFVTVGRYVDTQVKKDDTYDEVATNFQEYLIGTSVKVTSDEQTVSRKNGEKAKATKVEGESIKSGDFFFGSYNKLDNVLTVAMNCGAFQTGRMTATNRTKETVKINGTTYDVGFKGVVANLPFGVYDEAAAQAIIDTLEAGKDNVKYILADGNVVYMEATDNDATDKFFDYVVADFNGEYLEEALGLKEGKLADKLTQGFYLDNGEVKFAVLDTATGTWKLATLAEFDYNYNEDDDEFDKEITNVATLANYADITDLKKDGKADFDKVSTATEKTKIFAVVAEKNGAYTLAEVTDEVEGVTDAVKVADHDATCTANLTFSDDSAKTSKITSDKDVDTARVTLDANSLVIILNTQTGKVGVRKGVQKFENSVENVTFYAANSDVIFGTINDKTFDVDDWADKKSSIADDATYYVVTADTSFTLSTEKDGDDTTYTVTADGLFDLRTGKIVNGIVEENENRSDLVLYKKSNQKVGTVIYFDGGEEYEATALSGNVVAAIAKANDADDNGFTALDLSKFTFDDKDTVIYNGGNIDGKKLNGADAYTISVKVTTVIVDDFDEDYDMKNLYTDLEGEYDDVATMGDNDEYLEYAIEGDAIETITEPTEGVFDQFIIDTYVKSAKIYAPEKDEDADFGKDATIPVELFAAARFKDGKVFIEVIRLVGANIGA